MRSKNPPRTPSAPSGSNLVELRRFTDRQNPSSPKEAHDFNNRAWRLQQYFEIALKEAADRCELVAFDLACLGPAAQSIASLDLSFNLINYFPDLSQALQLKEINFAVNFIQATTLTAQRLPKGFALLNLLGTEIMNDRKAQILQHFSNQPWPPSVVVGPLTEYDKRGYSS